MADTSRRCSDIALKIADIGRRLKDATLAISLEPARDHFADCGAWHRCNGLRSARAGGELPLIARGADYRRARRADAAPERRGRSRWHQCSRELPACGSGTTRIRGPAAERWRRIAAAGVRRAEERGRPAHRNVLCAL